MYHGSCLRLGLVYLLRMLCMLLRVLQAMGELIEEGKIKAWGVSNETAYGVTMMCETAKRLGVPLPTTIQNDFSLCDRCLPLPPTSPPSPASTLLHLSIFVSRLRHRGWPE